MLLLLHCDRTQHRIGGHAVVQLHRMHVSRPSVRSSVLSQRKSGSNNTTIQAEDEEVDLGLATFDIDDG